MINTVNSSYIERENDPFYEFRKKSKASDYWQKANVSANIDEYVAINILSPEEARKKHNYKALGIYIASAMLVTAGTIFFFLKGGPRSFAKTMETLKKTL